MEARIENLIASHGREVYLGADKYIVLAGTGDTGPADFDDIDGIVEWCDGAGISSEVVLDVVL